MRKVLLVALILSFVLCSPLTAFTEDKPIKATAPLTADEIAIYRAVLLQQYGGSADSSPLNVSIRTYPLDPESPMSGGLKSSDCLKGIRLENLPAAAHSFHELPRDVLTGKQMTLVDPNKHSKIVRSNDPSKTIPKGKSVENAVEDAFASGLFSMSEIAFDRERHYAVVSYSFVCGGLCGSGSTIVFEKVNGEWKNAKRNCGSWIS